MSPIEIYEERFGSAYKWYATVTVMLATIATSAAITMVNVALPDIMGAFGLGEGSGKWLIALVESVGFAFIRALLLFLGAVYLFLSTPPAEPVETD